MQERNFLNLNLEQVSEALNEAQRPVTIVAASKTQSAGVIRQAWQAGVNNFGENYLTEALEKMPAVADLAITWHYIGRIQSNKTRPIAEHFSWVHTIDRVKIARRLSEHRTSAQDPLNVLIQVNIDADANKAGVTPAEVPVLIEAILPLPNLMLRGFMTMLNPATKPADGYRSMAQLAQELRQKYLQQAELDCLSMGMSADWSDAVAEGANIIRLGTALFGARAVAQTP